MAVAAFSGSLIFLLLKKTERPDGLLVSKDEEAADFKKDIAATFKLLISPRMLHIHPLIIWTALSAAAFSNSFVPLMYESMKAEHETDWTSDEKLAMSLYAMIPLGLGEVIGGLVQGKIADRFGVKAGLVFILVLTAVAFGAVFGTIAQYKFGVLTFLMTFAWGLQDSSVNNFINCVLAFEFESKVTPFSVNKFSQSLFVFAFIIVASYINTQARFYIYFGVMCGFAFLALGSIFCFKFKGKE